MATRTDAEKVKDVLATSLEDTQIEAFISDANVWVTEELGNAGLTTGRLEIIERYLACALVRIRDLGLKSSAIENVSEAYQVDPQVTDYLIRAASFDPTGKIRQNFLVTAADAAKVKPVLFQAGSGFRCESSDV